MRRCGACGGELPAEARFCPHCGRPSGAFAEEQRRIVTVVFADLAGFTALSERRDPEAVKELLDACFGTLVPVIEQHGGHVDKIIGDELMAVFGAPIAHEDDPERAVRAALGLVAALERLDAELVLRVGITTGEVLAGPVGPGGAYTVTGDTVNTAHRLASVAGPGEILVGERTHQATATAVDYEPRPAFQLRGKREPVAAWAVVGVGEGRRRPAERPARQPAPFGRDRVVSQLAATVARVFDERRPAVIPITGEPGIGKTCVALAADEALANRRRRRRRGPHRTLWVACPPYGPSGPTTPLAELARAALAVDPNAPPEDQRGQVTAAIPPLAAAVDADADLLTRRISSLLGLDPEPARPTTGPVDAGPRAGAGAEESLAAVRQVLEATAAAQPTLVVIDDLHWADPVVLGFLEHLSRRMGAVSLAVLALARDEVLERRPALARADRGVAPVALGPLPERASRQLLERVVGELPVPAGEEVDALRVGPETERRLLSAAGGNPLLLGELVRYLVDTGGLVVDDGRAALRLDRESDAVPDSVRALLDARLDALPPEPRRFILDAAIVGARFRMAIVEDLGSYERPVELVNQLVARRLVERVTDAYAEYGFCHVLTRDVAYAAVPIGERAVKHARIAHWLEAHHPEPNAAVIRGLAYHYDRAVTSSRELEHTDPGIAGAAFDALVRAAHQATRDDALREAARWYRRALALGSLDREAYLQAVNGHGEVLMGLRRLDEARDEFQRVRSEAESSPSALVATATMNLAVVARLQGQAEASRHWFDDARAIRRELGDRPGEAVVYRAQGRVELLVGRPRSALARLTRAADLERAACSDGQETAETLQLLGWSQYLVGDFEAARVALWDSASRFAATEEWGPLSWCWGILGLTFLQAAQPRRTLEIAENLLEQAHRRDDPWTQATAQLLCSVAYAVQGQLSRASDGLDEPERLFAEQRDAWGSAMVTLARGLIDRYAGRWELARRRLSGALDVARRVEWVAEEARLSAELAQVELEAGDLEAATGQARAALALVRAGIGDRESELRALVVLGEAAWRADDLAPAQLLFEEAAGLGQEPGSLTTASLLAWAALARLLAHTGDFGAARSLAEQAWVKAGDAAEVVASAARALAAVRAAQGQTGEAGEILESVLGRWEGEGLAFLEPLRVDLSRLVDGSSDGGARG